MHNSRRPLDRLTIILTLTFDIIFIVGQGIVMVMDYPCAEFSDFSFSRFGFIVRTERQTERQNHRQTESQRRINAILKRLPSTRVMKA